MLKPAMRDGFPYPRGDRKIISQPPIKPRRIHRRLSRSRSADTTRQCARLVSHWIVSIGLDERFFGAHSLRGTKVTAVYRRTGRRRRRPWTWDEHLPPSSAVRNSNMEGQLWVTGGKTRSEYMFSVLPQIADIARSEFSQFSQPTVLPITRSADHAFWARAIP